MEKRQGTEQFSESPGLEVFISNPGIPALFEIRSGKRGGMWFLLTECREIDLEENSDPGGGHSGTTKPVNSSPLGEQFYPRQRRQNCYHFSRSICWRVRTIGYSTIVVLTDCYKQKGLTDFMMGPCAYSGFKSVNLSKLTFKNLTVRAFEVAEHY